MADLPSIEDLMKKPVAAAPATEPSAQEAFSEKMGEIRLDELEREASRSAQLLDVPHIALEGVPISPEALTLVPVEQAKQLEVIPFLFTGPELRLGARSPKAEGVEELAHQLAERYQTHAAVYQISEHSFAYALSRYAALPQIKTVTKGVRITDKELATFQSAMNTYADIEQVIQHASVTDFMTIVMAAGLKFDVSDIHIEAEEHGIVVRYRIDGVLQDVAKIPPESWKKVIARVKLISGLKINITEKPQDGRFTIFLKDADTDVRVSTIPTAFGESVVMRILKPTAIAVEFVQLGIRPAMEQKFEREIQKPHGMIITTGPTGSGKTTTLYAILRKLNTKDVKIITLEDPIEYKLEGINQSQVEHEKNYTFASGLRSTLRQDPDIIMVGEIRDLETAEVAINAALTGHLMLSTIHTNSAAGAIPRFLSMGVKPFLLAPSLNAIIGQRLVRRVHDACKETYTPTPDVLEAVKKQLAAIPAKSGEVVPNLETLVFTRGKGCAQCNQSGFKGRVGIYEIILMDDPIRKAMNETISEYDMLQLAIAQGMITMTQDGFLKAIEGLTTAEEVIRVSGRA